MAKKKKTFDFREVNVELHFDEWQVMDISKEVGNCVHRATSDLGVDENARQIYRTGEVSMEGLELEKFIFAVNNSDLIAPVKIAVIELLNK